MDKIIWDIRFRAAEIPEEPIIEHGIACLIYMDILFIVMIR